MRTKIWLSCLVLAAALAPAAPAAAAPGPEVVVRGLNNPRQVSFGPGHKTLIVAEAGRGGRRCGEFGCFGRTGSVTLVRRPGKTTNAAPNRVVTGLLSGAGPNGEFAIGADGACAHRLNEIYIAMAFAPPDAIPGGLPSRVAGKLLRADLRGNWRIYSDITAVERTDPDGQGFDSNPYAVLCLPNRQIVADAAGNTLIEVRNGRARVLTVFRDHHGVDSVPTSLTLGPDGFIYVGELAGEGKPGVARVYKLTRGGRIVDWVGGFTSVVGVDVLRDGTMYVSQLFGGPEGFGRLTKVAPNGRRSHRAVPLPGGVAAHRGKVYVAAWSVSPAQGARLDGFVLEPGQLWRLRW